MDIHLKCLRFTLPNFVRQNLGGLRRQNVLTILIITGVLLGIFPFVKVRAPQARADLVEASTEGLALIEGNSLLPLPGPIDPNSEAVQKIEVIVTAYSSSVWETDDSPYITAAGTQVREGIVANNLLNFGTQIKIPEVFGDKIFVVEDRLNSEKTDYHIDVWFPSYWEALNFGVKRTYIEVLEG